MNAPEEKVLVLPARHRENDAPQRRIVLMWCLAMLAVGSAISIGAFRWLNKDVLNDARSQFERHASDAHHSIETRIMSYTDIVYGLRAMIYSTDRMTREQFHKYVAGLNVQHRFPGFLNLNYAMHVPHESKASFENAVRRDTSVHPGGYPDFRIRPAGDRPYYHVVTYLEPMAGNEFSHGRDIIAAPPLKEIFERVIFATDELASSGRPPRIEGPPPFWGAAMRLAVYRQGLPLETLEQRRRAFLGTLGAGFRVDELLKNVLAKDILETLSFRVFDAGPTDPPARKEDRLLLFDSRAPDAAPGSDPKPLAEDFAFETAHSLNIAGRVWEIHYGARTAAMLGTGAALQPWLVLFGGLLISLLLFGMAYSLSSSRSRAMALADEITEDLQKSEAELRIYSERIKAVSGRLFEVQESERRLLATELHDRVGQNLSALGMNLSIIAAHANREESADLSSRLQDSTSLIENTADAIRNVMGELRPQAIDEYGLVAPLRAFATGFASRTGIKVEVKGPSQEMRLPRTVELAMFRITQEALSNIAKHSKATRVDIELANAGGAAVLSIVDDGIGFDAGRMESVRPEGHWGLLIMRERAEAAGAKFSIESAPGRTTLKIEYPLQKEGT
jgi:signal transduction histidine kinase